MKKFVFVTGGVVSGLGKGVTAASLGRLLKERGYKICIQKLDPYMNIDPGTMNPYQHGEVFVTEDGAETDLDLGHYERFIDENLSKFSNLTSGKVYWNVLNKERSGEYLGETIQVIPHITNEIKNFIYSLAGNSNCDIAIIEIGGTVGDIEIQPFLESARQIFIELGEANCLFVHLTLVPFNEMTCEYKSKPTQHSVKELRIMGINPKIIVTRSKGKIGKEIKDKIALFCNVRNDCVIENINLESIYDVPLELEKNKFSEIIIKELNLPNYDSYFYDNLKNKIKIFKKNKSDISTKIVIVGKYVKLRDAYLSIAEALVHAEMELNVKIETKWVDSEDLNDLNLEDNLGDCDGILIPGGFGSRGIDGMVLAVKYARENDVPYFGICLGMQVSVIEFARNVLNFKEANSKEFDENASHLVINLMKDQDNIKHKGGTMRLGSYPCLIEQDSLLYRCYKKTQVFERHRHRYEFNNKYLKEFIDHGMSFSGKSPDNLLIEAIELKNNRFFIGVQFHPEFKSRPGKAHPIFKKFIEKSLTKSRV
ncbi:MAG: CTP synthase [Candidatus Improbicoccus pseudotrichonymphae]|uniref:CTP synthase n=1 Tax=Candidatus Improbicoccus pseudotrichonymphae TaxID=3033792 RepID=A0AA48I8X3_9FIRM|nr:MAG: CTP synthase [Candidatus Improbicoccus pseudotrichonymphae]